MWEPRTEVDTAGLDQVGPVEYLIVEFTSGRVPADAFHELLGLAEDDRVRILDLEFVFRDLSGRASFADPDRILTDVGQELATLAGASSGLLDDDDAARIGELIRPGSLAGIVLYENVWLTAMADQLRRHEAQLISIGQIPVTDLDAALNETGT
jgi:hypothetical protein